MNKTIDDSKCWIRIFAYKNPFNEKLIVGCHTGWKVSKQAIDQKYSDKIARYASCNGNRPDNHCIDANCTTNSVLRYANNAREPCLNNLKFRQRTRGQGHYGFSVIGKIIRLIRHGEDYWVGGSDYYPSWR